MKLAINGGKPIRTVLFPSQNTMGKAEEQAVIKAIRKGRLSGYRGNWCSEFFGGEEIQKLEKAFRKKFNVQYAIAINSCTSGLHVACGAIGLKPGDEVIVTPYSMTCSATAPMIYGAIPIFADIEKNYYCIDPESVEKKITTKTRAIIAVSLFGQPYDPKINEIAKKYNLFVIEDAAQAIGSSRIKKGRILSDKGNILPPGEQRTPIQYYTGTNGHIGVFSFNYGKHITCGEGGVIVTNNKELAMICRLISNHAEAVIHGMPKNSNMRKYYLEEPNMIGFNMRMTELSAAIMQEQLKKFDRLLNNRLANVNYLNARLSQIPAISVSLVRENCTHSYYVLAYQWDSDKANGLHRDKFIEAVKAELQPRTDREGEGIPIGCGYIAPLYKMPLFNYTNLCPICEDLSYNKLFLTLYHAPNSTIEDMEDVGDAFEKVWENRKELQ